MIIFLEIPPNAESVLFADCVVTERECDTAEGDVPLDGCHIQHYQLQHSIVKHVLVNLNVTVTVGIIYSCIRLHLHCIFFIPISVD